MNLLDARSDIRVAHYRFMTGLQRIDAINLFYPNITRDEMDTISFELTNIKKSIRNRLKGIKIFICFICSFHNLIIKEIPIQKESPHRLIRRRLCLKNQEIKEKSQLLFQHATITPHRHNSSLYYY